MDKLSEKILPISLQKEFNHLLGYAFPLCILLNNEKNLGWYYENYIETYAQLRKGYQIRFDVMDVLSYKEYETKIMETSRVDLIEASRIKSIEKEIIRKLKADKYIIIFLDQYYIMDSDAYNLRHYPHEVLIYGYKDEMFKAIAFDKNRIFNKINITHKELQSSFQNVLNKKIWTNETEIEENIIYYFNIIDQDISYPFNFNEFIEKLDRYHKSKIRKKDFYLKNYQDKEDEETIYSVVGIDTYNVFIDYFKNVICVAEEDPEKFVQYIEAKYNFIHIFYQHKDGLSKRFDYINKNIFKSKVFQEKIEEYKALTKELLKIRLAWIKLIKKIKFKIYSNKNKKEASDYAKKIMKEFLESIIMIKEKEEVIIKEILDELKKIKIEGEDYV